jgi:cytochrome b involved in lipid metabolism
MGKGGDKVMPKDSAMEVLIDGQLYDISSLKHPGGSIIKFYQSNGVDASQAFHNFHFRSKKAKKYLDSLPHRPADQVLATPAENALSNVAFLTPSCMTRLP